MSSTDFKEVFEILGKWVKELKDFKVDFSKNLGIEIDFSDIDFDVDFDGFYIFGSLVDDKGEDFYEATSDIDLIIIFSETSDSAFKRAKLCKALRCSKNRLEDDLRKKFKRDGEKAIVSSVLLTKSEVMWDIHKSNNPLFFRNNHLAKGFHSLIEGRELPSPKGCSQREQLWGFVQAFSETQDYRHRYLKVCSNQEVEAEIGGNDFPLPILKKSLMRCAAYVRHLENAGQPIDSSFKNTIDGKNYLISLLKDKNHKPLNGDNSFEYKIWQGLERKLGRDTPDAAKPSHLIQPFDLLLLYELLFDKAFELFSNALNNALETPNGVLTILDDTDAKARTQSESLKKLRDTSLNTSHFLIQNDSCKSAFFWKLAYKVVVENSDSPSNDIVEFIKKLDQLMLEEAEAMGSLVCMRSYQQSKAIYMYEMVAEELPQDYKSFKQKSSRFSYCNRKDPSLLELNEILKGIKEKVDIIKMSIEKFAPTEEQHRCKQHYQYLSTAVDKLREITDSVNRLGGSKSSFDALSSCLNKSEFHTQKISEYLRDVSKRYREMIVE